MKKKTLVTLVCITAAAGMAAAWMFGEKEIEVETELAARGDVLCGMELTGEVIPSETYVIASQVTGQVTHLSVRPGEEVSASQLVAVVEEGQSSELAAVSSQSLMGPSAALLQQTSPLEGFLSQAQSTSCELGAFYAAAAGTEGQMAQPVSSSLGEPLGREQQNSDSSQIRSEGRGVILSVEAAEGQLIQMGMPIATVAKNNSLRIAAAVSEEEVTALKKGMACTFTLPGRAEQFEGTVESISATAGGDMGNRSVCVTLCPETPVVCPIGTTAEVYVPFETAADVIRIPGDALDEEGWVYCVDEQRKLRRVPVSVGIQNDYYAEILTGIAEGDEIVLSPDSQLREGTRVKAVD